LSIATWGRRTANLLGFMACAALMAYALYSEHVLGLEPCPLCIFQRVAVIAVGILFLVAAVHNPSKKGSLFYGVLILVAALTGIGIAARHLWIQAQPPGTVAACGAGLDYMMEILPLREVIATVLTGSGECGTVNWRFLGLAMPGWVLIALVVLAIWAALANLTERLNRR
jgi:disulfide bond formation protein DsbB